jgi:hypothetical protein
VPLSLLSLLSLVMAGECAKHIALTGLRSVYAWRSVPQADAYL